MPSIEDVNRFNQLLVGLADEPEYLERIGQEIGPPTPPVDTSGGLGTSSSVLSGCNGG